MASISDTTGTVEIEANSYRVIEELKKYFKTASTWKYNISCKDLDDKKILNSTAEEVGYGYLLYFTVCWFDGSGYESFSATLNLFQEWLEEKVIPHNQLLRDSEFKLTFKYVDQSSSQNFISESERSIGHDSGAGITNGFCNYEYKYDYTLVNKATCLAKNLGEVIANELEGKSYLEILSILQRDREQIEEYTGKLLEVFLYENELGRYAEIYNNCVFVNNSDKGLFELRLGGNC